MQIECKTMKEMLRKCNMAINKVASKIFLTYDGIFGKDFGSSLEEDASLEKQIGTVGNVQCLLHIVVGTPPILQKEDDPKSHPLFVARVGHDPTTSGL